LCAGCVASAHAAETPEFVLQWGGPGAGTGKFVSPRAVAVDSEGRILVPDDSAACSASMARGSCSTSGAEPTR